MLLNVGPTRADGLPGVEKIDVPSRAVMRQVAREVMLVLVYPHFQPVLIFLFLFRRGTRARTDPVIIKMLESGIENPPPPDDDDYAPRAAG